MKQPLISIVLCSYNGERFIEAQLQSLLQQTYPNLEIIISDDVSTDGTRTILRRYETISNCKIFLQDTNLGPIKNFEFAIKQTTGAFIAFCDQDDIWLPQKIETLYGAIGDGWFVYSDSELIDEQGRSLQKKLSDLRKMYSGSDTRGFVFSNVVWGHTVLINRLLMPYILPIPDAVPHDIWMAVIAATKTGIRYTDMVLTKYRQHADTVTKTIATDRHARTSNKRYLDYKEKLHWISLVRQSESSHVQPFYDTLYTLYEEKASGRFQVKLLFFLMKNRAALYKFSCKSTASQVIDIIKQARGVTS